MSRAVLFVFLVFPIACSPSRGEECGGSGSLEGNLAFEVRSVCSPATDDGIMVWMADGELQRRCGNSAEPTRVIWVMVNASDGGTVSPGDYATPSPARVSYTLDYNDGGLGLEAVSGPVRVTSVDDEAIEGTFDVVILGQQLDDGGVVAAPTALKGTYKAPRCRF